MTDPFDDKYLETCIRCGKPAVTAPIGAGGGKHSLSGLCAEHYRNSQQWNLQGAADGCGDEGLFPGRRF